MIVPAPVQAAMVAALGDDAHVAEQRAALPAADGTCCVRRSRPPASASSTPRRGSTSGSTRDEDCWETVRRLAGLGILVAPGAFYGAAGARHVRVALTATDERVDAAASRLSAVCTGG